MIKFSVPDLAQALAFYTSVLGASLTLQEFLLDGQVVAMEISISGIPVLLTEGFTYPGGDTFGGTGAVLDIATMREWNDGT